MSKQLTLRDIADKAGVSEMTASRALRNANDVSERTRARVLAAAQELGYVRNRIAGALASNRVDLVGVIIPSVKSYVFSEVLDGISEALSDTRLRPVFGMTDYDLDTEADVIAEMLSWRPSGLIIAGLEHSERGRKMLETVDIPVVEIMDTDGDPVDFAVGISHKEAGRKMARALLDRGYSKIGFVGTKMSSDFRAQKRLQGFEEELATAGLALNAAARYLGGSSLKLGRELTAQLLQDAPDTDAIYYSTDISAAGGLLHCEAAGLSVPGDLALAGFNKLGVVEGMHKQLATIDSLRFEVGKKAAELILEINASPDADPEKVTEFSPQIILGESI